MIKQSIPEKKSNSTSQSIKVPALHTCYEISGKHFYVERIFSSDAHDSLSMVLLKLIKADIAPF